MTSPRSSGKDSQREGHDEGEGDADAVEGPVEVIVLLADIDHAELEGAIDLLGREADAGGGVHRGDHLLDQTAEVGVEARHLFPLGAEHGLVEMDNAQGHWSREEVPCFAGRGGQPNIPGWVGRGRCSSSG
jgi:hypothetical protein